MRPPYHYLALLLRIYLCIGFMAPNAIISRRRDFFRLVYVYLVLLETSAVRTVIASPSGAASPLTFAGSAHASCASHISTPVYIPIRNVSLSDQTLRRGAAISVGTPSRPFAFALSGFVLFFKASDL